MVPPSVVEEGNQPKVDLEAGRESFHGSSTHARQAAAERLQGSQAMDTKNGFCSPKYSNLRGADHRSWVEGSGRVGQLAGSG